MCYIAIIYKEEHFSTMKRIISFIMALCIILSCAPALAVTYKQGSKGKEVMAIKERMYELGYYTAMPSHNQFNDIMTERVKQLQKVNGLEETGVIDEALYELIMSDQVLSKNGRPAGTLMEGDNNAQVKQLKERMQELLYFKPDSGMNSTYNDTMTERVKLLQRTNGLEETGFVTPELYNFIMSDDCLRCGDWYEFELTADAQKNYVLSGEKQYSLSASGNVVIFLLDYTANTYLSKTLKEFPHALDAFKDFTYYDNCDPRYIGTFPSTPAMFTGCEFDTTVMIGEWFRNIWTSDSANYLYDQIHKLGYEFNYFYHTPVCAGMKSEAMGKVDNLIDLSQHDGSEIPSIYCYADFMENLHKKGLTVDETDTKYIQIMHLYGSHPPYTVNRKGEDDASCSREENLVGYLYMVETYINMMKEAGLYDDATIIVTADHGDKMGNMQVIYFIKEPGATGDAYATNSAPISHTDFPGTLLKLIGGDFSQYGTSIFDWNEGDKRERQCSLVGIDAQTFPLVSCYKEYGLGSYNYWRTFTYTGDNKDLSKLYKRNKYSYVPLTQSMF